jgi:hypothetical protein
LERKFRVFAFEPRESFHSRLKRLIHQGRSLWIPGLSNGGQLNHQNGRAFPTHSRWVRGWIDRSLRVVLILGGSFASRRMVIWELILRMVFDRSGMRSVHIESSVIVEDAFAASRRCTRSYIFFDVRFSEQK